jgi:hypothetical protein
MRLHHPSAAGAVVLCAAALCCATASATPTLSGRFGGTGSGLGQFSSPGAIAIDQSNGDVYVVDKANERVEKFTASGEPLLQFNGSATPAGEFAFTGEATGVAVDNSSGPSAGDVYVVDRGHRTVDKFSSTGAYLSQVASPANMMPVAVAVDQAAHLWIAEEEENHHVTVREFDDEEPNLETEHWEVAHYNNGVTNGGLAVGANGSIYLDLNQLVAKYTDQGSFEGEVRETTLETEGMEPFGIDPANEYLYGYDFDAGMHVYDPSGMFNPESHGRLLEVFGVQEHPVVTGIAIDGLGGKIYVSFIDGETNTDEVLIYSFPVPPGLALNAASEVTASGAVLSGTVNPLSHETNTIQFEYGTSEAYGSTIAAAPAEAGSGTGPVPVSATLSGLIPNTIYHYRLDATSVEGTSTAADQTFRTPPVAATVTDKPSFAAEVTSLTATLHGTINPGNGLASYHFVYGPTSAYGSVAPTPEGVTPVNYEDDEVAQGISGLKPGTTYHFALVASNTAGTVTGPDETFTTPSVPAPVVTTGLASATRGEALVTGTVNPEGWETSYLIEYGTTTAYGSSWPTVFVELGSFDTAQNVAVTLQNLQPLTTYHYRVVAVNPGGSSYGPDMTFTTSGYLGFPVPETPVLSASLGFVFPSSAPLPSKPTKRHGKAKHKRLHGKRRRSK